MDGETPRPSGISGRLFFRDAIRVRESTVGAGDCQEGCGMSRADSGVSIDPSDIDERSLLVEFDRDRKSFFESCERHRA